MKYRNMLVWKQTILNDSRGAMWFLAFYLKMLKTTWLMVDFHFHLSRPFFRRKQWLIQSQVGLQQCVLEPGSHMHLNDAA